MAVNSLHGILKNLSEFFDSELTFDEIDEAYDNSVGESDEEEDPSGTDPESDCVESLRILSKIKYDNKCIDVLNDLISASVQNRETPGVFFNQCDSWEFLGKYIKIEALLSFVYCLVRLSKHNCLDRVNRKLSVLTARCYMVLLTTPGAKSEKVFNDNVCMRALEPFEVVRNLRTYRTIGKINHDEVSEYLMDLYNYLLELKIVFGYVSLDEHVNVLKSILSRMAKIIRDHYYSGYDSIYAYYMTIEAYQVLEVICTTGGEQSDNFLKILMCVTSRLHLYTDTPKFAANISFNYSTTFDCSIVQFMLNLLNKQPNNVMNMLKHFIKSVITKRDTNLTEEYYAKILDACVVYEMAMYNEYRTTCLPFLEEATQFDNSVIRQNTILLLGKMLLVNSNVQPNYMLRELKILKIILKSMIDVDTNVKVSALHAFRNALKTGNKNCQKIFKIAFENAQPSVDYDPYLSDTDMPSSATDIYSTNPLDASKFGVANAASVLQIFPVKKCTQTSENIDIIQTEISELVRTLLYLLNSTFFNIRQCVIEILEYLLSKNIELVENPYFYNYYTEVSTDSAARVRRQHIIAIDRLIEAYPTHEIVVQVYTECIIDLLKDRDKQIFSLAIDSINKRIFNCLNTFEMSQSPIHKRPWLFFRVIFKMNLCNAFYEVMDALIKHNVVTQKTLNIVQTHLSTTNASEAWTVTYFLSKKIKSNNPECIIAAFKDVIINPEIVRYESYDFIFQVINKWIDNFQRSTLQKLQEMMCDIIHSCSSEPHMMSNLYNFAKKSHSLCHNTIDFSWISEIYDEATAYIILNKEDFLSDAKLDPKFAQKLYIFSESSSDLLERPNPEVIDLMLTLLRNVESQEIHPMDRNYNEKICIIIIVFTRILLRDSMLALDVVQHYIKIAAITSMSFHISSNLAHAFRDLFVKFGILMESTLKCLARQILSEYTKIRLQALTFLAEIIMKDLTKMTQFLLFHIFLAVTDSDRKISKLAKKLIIAYVEHRSHSMLRDCFIDNICIFYQYVEFTQFTFVGPAEIQRTMRMYDWPDDNERTYDLYNFIIESIDPFEGYKLFEWIKILNIEMNSKTYNVTKAKLIIRDSLFILRKLCFQLTIGEETCSKRSGKNDEVDVSDDENDEERKLILEAKPKESVEPYISIVPKFYENLKLRYPEYEHKLDRLMEALCICFQDMIAVPSAFWDPYLNKLQNKIRLSKDYPCSAKANEKLRLINYLTHKDRDPLEAYFYR